VLRKWHRPFTKRKTASPTPCYFPDFEVKPTPAREWLTLGFAYNSNIDSLRASLRSEITQVNRDLRVRSNRILNVVASTAESFATDLGPGTL